MYREMKLLSLNLILIQLLSMGCYGTSLPKELTRYISAIHVDSINGRKSEISYQEVSSNITKVTISLDIIDTTRLDDWQVNITPSFVPTFHWAPHLTPTAEYIMPQHVFRAPTLIMANKEKQLTLIPDVELLDKKTPVDWYMDLDASTNKLVLGMSLSTVKEHVLYTRKVGAIYPPGKINFGFYIMTAKTDGVPFNPWRQPLSFFWKKWGLPLYQQGEPLKHRDLEPYVKHSYNWAFNTWKEQVWQEFNLMGRRVGGPTFIVNVTQSPNYSKEVNEREFRSIWNQAWFNSLRSAQGLYRYAKRTRQHELMGYALKTKELALAFPQTKGFFPALIATEMKDTLIQGKSYNRSSGWHTFYFGNSNRNPYTDNAREAPYHLLDMSYTAWLMLTWYDELEKDRRLLDYAITYANGLLRVQQADGFFPGWLTLDSLQPMEHLNQSPETSMSVTFLLKLYEVTREERYKSAALKAMQAVIDQVIPMGQWEDFETYWSCSRYGALDLVDRKVKRNNLFKQNTLSIYWTAQALLASYQTTRKPDYLNLGTRTLDELLMVQQVWQPPFIHIPALGGFGVMNADGEWNDSRQSLFAELLLDYGKELGNLEYTQRGLAALRASFVMMYCPENPDSKTQWEQAWPFFGEKDYGFMMENYGHGGVTNEHGLGIGEFTIYDWGNGAAAEAYNRIIDHYGRDFLEAN